MDKLRKVGSVAAYNFRGWHKNPRIIVTFALAFILCFLLSDKTVRFAHEYNTTMQLVEAFVWTFGDSNSILLSSLLLLLLFADIPFLGAGVPFYLMRIDRKTWLMGQSLYVVLATGVYLIFILFSTVLLCMSNSFISNMWSDTAAILSYSDSGKTIALPSLVKTLEMSTPYETMFTIFLLMLLYTLLMAFMMLMLNIIKGQSLSVVGVFIFSLYGFILNPQLIRAIFNLPDELMYKANVAIGWISPLNHATYNMHNFGYDLLPTLWQSCLIFILLILICFGITLRCIRNYNFNFTGTEV
ncbi:hypothetical protein [Clostridium sp. YIM B02551]|uniref:hypothetical protein n=1 Tax=Clostridium sp. YIM B02551 TaxID=2910679 RepID=UPI001EE9EBDB|nr:hypothetical protein [Clostridium sp. YIM B02551]